MTVFRKPIALLDACVLYPAPIRDFLLHIAHLDGFQPKWSLTIHDEWIRNLLLNRPDLHERQLRRTVDEMNRAFPDANVDRFERLLPVISLPDVDDRHVAAAAMKCRADVIVTFNLKDFPDSHLSSYLLRAQHPDHFILDLIDTDPERVFSAFLGQVNSLRNPPKTQQQVIATLMKCGLEQTGEWLSMMGA
jgi:hypothetical protein